MCDEHDEKKILSSPVVTSVNRRATDFLFFFAILGMAPLSVEWLFWQRKEELPEDLVFWISRLAFANEPTSMKNRKKSGGFQIHTMGKRKHLTEMISKNVILT